MNGGKYDENALDSLIREAMSKDRPEMETLPFDELWDGFLQKRERFLSEMRPVGRRGAMKWLLRGAVGLAAVAFAVGLWVTSPRASALGPRVVRFFSAAVTETLTNLMVSFGWVEETTGTGTEPPPPDSPGQAPRTVTLEEAKSLAPFRIRSPSFLPDGMKNRSVRFEHLSENTARVVMTYGDGQGRHLILEQVNIPEGMGTGLAYDNDDAQVEKVQVGTTPGLLIRFKDQTSHLFWVDQGVSLQLYGNIDGEMMLKIARSIE